MQVDPEYLRKHYSTLSDEALLDIDRSELVDMAQKCYDDEVRSRRTQSQSPSDRPIRPSEPLKSEDAGEQTSEVYSYFFSPGTTPTDSADEAREVLEAAGIPCHLDVSEIPKEETGRGPEPTHQLRLLVPAKFNLHATSVLERDIFNQQFEDTWKSHLELLSDEELRSLHPEVAFCGLYDRIERVTRAYDEEIARRRLS